MIFIKKYLILRHDINYVFYPYLQKKEIHSFYPKFINRIFIKIFSKLNLNFLLFGNWKKFIKEVDFIIIFDTLYQSNIAKYIKKKNKNCRIIFYYWNTISVFNQFVLNDKNIDDIWTFDKKDAIKYHLKWNPQFYTLNIKLDPKELIYDVIFLGRDKNRKSMIENTKVLFNKMNIKTKLLVIKNEKDFLDYDDYLKLLNKSVGILDIVTPSQTGLTLRTMESLFLEKKLITNNKDIKNYSFYNKKNIFLLGEDQDETLLAFLKKPYEKVPQEIVEEYDYKNWLNRFFKDM